MRQSIQRGGNQNDRRAKVMRMQSDKKLIDRKNKAKEEENNPTLATQSEEKQPTVKIQAKEEESTVSESQVLTDKVAEAKEPIPKKPEIDNWEYKNEKGSASSSDNYCATCPIVLGVNTPDDRYFSNGIEMKINLKGHREGYTYDIKRKFDRAYWEKVPVDETSGKSKWVRTGNDRNVSDDATNNDEYLTPQTKGEGEEPQKVDPSKTYYIYSKDRPGIGRSHPQEKPNATEVIFMSNFIESVKITNQNKRFFASHTDKKVFKWHCVIHVKKEATGWVIDESQSSISEGHVSLGQPTN